MSQSFLTKDEQLKLNITWVIVLNVSFPDEVLSKLEHNEEAEEADTGDYAHHGQRAYKGTVADVKVLCAKKERSSDDRLQVFLLKYSQTVTDFKKHFLFI